MSGHVGFLNRVTGILAEKGINIKQLTQPDSETIITIAVREEDTMPALAALYSELFR